jgi:cyclopropane fatty-acyl-phospholipid synthase-like methyltransferase
VIDASCGLGYGTHILSLHAGYVTGLDVNSEYIGQAKEIFKSDNITFKTYMDYYEGPDSRADKIVCIETLEHMSQPMTGPFLMSLLPHLESGGDMFVTVPLGQNQPSTYNKYHLNEPSIDYVYTLFSGLFGSIHMDISTFTNSFGYETNYCLITLKGYTGSLK